MGEPLRLVPNEIGIRIVDQNILAGLIAAWREEVKSAPHYSQLPRHMPFWPPQEIVDRLASMDRPWPPAAKRLQRRASDFAKKWADYDRNYIIQLKKMFKLAAAGKLKIFGSIIPGRGALIQLIDPSYFLGEIAMDDRGSIGPSPNVTRLYAPLRHIPGRLPIYHNVRLDLCELKKAAQRMPAARLQTNDVEIKKWYVDTWLPECQRTGRTPSREDDLEAARAEFGNFRKARDFMRVLRRELAPSTWSSKGRRKLAQK